MKTIRDTRLFEKLISVIEDDQASYKDVWRALFYKDVDGSPCIENVYMPRLTGGLDHWERKKKGVYFYDRGCNGWDGSFVIRPELEVE
jgi:hypothetical protein